MTQIKDLSKLLPGQKVIHLDTDGKKEVGIVTRQENTRVWFTWGSTNELYFWHNTSTKLYYFSKLDRVLA